MADEVIGALTVNGPPTLGHIDFAALDTFRFPDGGGFPDSYKAFVRHAGWARSFGLWLVYPPLLPGYADGWHGRARNLTTRFHAAYVDGRDEGFDWMVDPDADWSLPASLHVFGWSENGDALLWDTSARDANGEFPVWESQSLNSLHRLGDTLNDALPLVRDRAVGLSGSGPYDIEPLPPSRL
ncbi:hypothetical protein [Rhodococcus triatomae]